MKQSILVALAVTLVSVGLAGCGNAAGGGLPLDYAARSGRPEISVQREKVALDAFLKNDCATCVNGETNVSVVSKVERSQFPDFPGGREVPCVVDSVPWSYDRLLESCEPGRPANEAAIRLRVAAPADGLPQAYDLHVVSGERVLPKELARGDSVTLRFLGDGRFFDVKEWSDAHPRVCPVSPTGRT